MWNKALRKILICLMIICFAHKIVQANSTLNVSLLMESLQKKYGPDFLTKQRKPFGRTLLMMEILDPNSTNIELVNVMLQGGAGISVLDYTGEAALHHAINAFANAIVNIAGQGSEQKKQRIVFLYKVIFNLLKTPGASDIADSRGKKASDYAQEYELIFSQAGKNNFAQKFKTIHEKLMQL